jgi:holo-[acyl-carrier protein] synthase
VIIGIGTDLIKIDRIKALLIHNRQRFLQRILTKDELKILKEGRITGYVAKRFSAKEAFAKALGTGIGKHLSFQDIEIFQDPNGKPYFKFSDKLKEFLYNNYGKEITAHLSMTDESEFAQTFVVIEKKHTDL